MRLSDVDILEKLRGGQIVIDPPPTEACIGSFSIDVRLGDRFQIFQPPQTPYLDLADPGGAYALKAGTMQEVVVEPGGRFFLHPGAFALGVTVERIRLAHDIVGWLDGRSSLARVGLMVHMTAHAIDPGWDGRVTFEFFNAGHLPLALKPGIRIGAISFESLNSPTSRPYGHKQGAKYQGQQGPLPSRIARDDHTS
ncbi:MAG: dCTP deaminase [Magnetococcales bacterium]|nr:dCTP deaminase [Magnetococcales bacterium]